MRLIFPILLSVTLTGGMAHADAQAKLAAEDELNAGLLVVSVADKIRRECDSITARIFQARSFVINLKEHAAERGYTNAEVDEYIKNRENRAAMRALRNEYYKSKGASNLDPESLCVLGYAEIDQQSQVGSLLRAK